MTWGEDVTQLFMGTLPKSCLFFSLSLSSRFLPELHCWERPTLFWLTFLFYFYCSQFGESVGEKSFFSVLERSHRVTDFVNTALDEQ